VAPALMTRALWSSAYHQQQPILLLRPLAIDYRLARVSRFYGGVHHACVEARSAYSTVHGVAVVDAQQVVAAATLGHVAVVGVGSGVEMGVRVTLQRTLVRNRGLRSATGLRAKLLEEARFFGVGEETVSGH
jgi:hypothetical protein